MCPDVTSPFPAVMVSIIASIIYGRYFYLCLCLGYYHYSHHHYSYYYDYYSYCVATQYERCEPGQRGAVEMFHIGWPHGGTDGGARLVNSVTTADLLLGLAVARLMESSGDHMGAPKRVRV